MAKKITTEEIKPVSESVNISGDVSIKIVKDTEHLKKGEVYRESADIASLLISRGIAEVLK